MPHNGEFVLLLAGDPVLDWDRAGLLKTPRTLRGAGLQNAGAGADDAEAWALARLPLQRFRLTTADVAAHDFVGQVFSPAAAGLGAQPVRHRKAAWSLRAAAGS